MEKVIWPAIAGRGAATNPDIQRTATLSLALFALYLTLDWVTYMLPARFGITPFNPEAAVAIALLMFCGFRFVPLVFLAVLWGEWSLPVPPRPLELIVLNSAILTAAFASIAYLLSRRYRTHIDLNTRQDVLRLMGVTFTCMLVVGATYVCVLVWFGIGPWDRYYNGVRRFFIGYSVGVLVAAPLLFMLFSEKRRQQFMTFLRTPVAYAQMATVAACVWWVFLQAPQEHIRNFYLLFLPLIWMATRFGMVGASSALVLIQAGLLWFMYLSKYQPLSGFDLQLLLIALAIAGLLLGVSIDEQQRVAADFRESLKLAAAGEMAAAITHEINQPLTALSVYATAGQLIAAAPTLDRAQLNDTLRKLVDESKRAAAVVRRLRDFFHTGATRLERISLAELTTRVIDSLQARALAAQITATCRFAANIPPVLVDSVQFEVVLRNLLLNAMDSASTAGSPGGRVSVEIEANKAGEVWVTVRDSGSGVRARDADSMFESFVTTKSSGMGMGLAISRAIVEAHGGRIWAVPGDTGRLCFTLPQDGSLHSATAG